MDDEEIMEIYLESQVWGGMGWGKEGEGRLPLIQAVSYVIIIGEACNAVFKK